MFEVTARRFSFVNSVLVDGICQITFYYIHIKGSIDIGVCFHRFITSNGVDTGKLKIITLLKRGFCADIFNSKDRSNNIGERLLNWLVFLLLSIWTLSTYWTIFIHLIYRHIFLLYKRGTYLLKYTAWLDLWRLRRRCAIVYCRHCSWSVCINLQALPYVLL